MKHLLVVIGPTAVGKTHLAIRLAKEFNTEIISADSRQVFKEMHIGTAKPGPEELNAVPHHFIDSHSIRQNYTAGIYEREVTSCLKTIFSQKEVVIMTGGSGLYIKAVTEGIADIPSIEPGVREGLKRKLDAGGLEGLLDDLKKVDPEYYNLVDLNNPHRVMRALEVYLGTGNKYSEVRNQSPKKRPFNIIKVGLTRPREELYEIINTRMDDMIDRGLFGEAEKLYPYRMHQALQTVGYKEIFEYMDGNYDKDEAVRLLKRNTRRYAKRQLTWFGQDKDLKWFHPNDYFILLKYIKEKMAE